MNQEVYHDLATFAGGCFWCLLTPFKELNGVVAVVVGYTGGSTKNPTYEEVCMGTTGHFEAVQITFDSTVISYNTLLEVFWRQIDPTDPEGQFFDRGPSYRTAIFYHNDKQHKAAELSKKQLAESGRFSEPIATQILPAQIFYPAEEYHQNYPERNPEHYTRYRRGSGRDTFIKEFW